MSKSEPCTICGKDDFCARSADGAVAKCRRHSSHFLYGTGWQKPDSLGNAFYYFSGKYFSGGKNRHSHDQQPATIPQPVLRPRLATYNPARFADSLTTVRAAALAKSLGLPKWAISAGLGIGYRHPQSVNTSTGESDEGWTFSQQDGAGNTIGFAVRKCHDGSKSHVTGTRAGIFAPPGWDTSHQPLLLVEGASDTIAATASGLCAIGRPSNRGGVEFLAEMVSKIPLDRTVIVVGENDLKPDDHPTVPGFWPGRVGAYETATRLAQIADRPIRWAMTPEGVKDTRDWLTSHARDQKKATWQLAGLDLLSNLMASSRETVKSPPLRCEMLIEWDCDPRVKLRLKGKTGHEHEGKRQHRDCSCKRWQCEGCRGRKANKYLAWFYRCFLQWCDPLRFLPEIPRIDSSEVADGVPPQVYPNDYAAGPWSLHAAWLDQKRMRSVQEMIRRKNKDVRLKTEFVSVRIDPMSCVGVYNWNQVQLQTPTQLDRLFFAAFSPQCSPMNGLAPITADDAVAELSKAFKFIPTKPRDGEKRLDPISQSEGWRMVEEEKPKKWGREGLAQTMPTDYKTPLAEKHGVNAHEFESGIIWDDDAAGGAVRSWVLSAIDDPYIANRQPDANVRAELANKWADFLTQHPVTFGPCVRQKLFGLMVRPPESGDWIAITQAARNDEEIAPYLDLIPEA
ncbi:MAG: hypothetical protein U0791_02670 [Gemmataceae bacterium]